MRAIFLVAMTTAVTVAVPAVTGNAVIEPMDWYNAHRSHSSLERLTPNEKYHAALPQLKQAA
jgi:hypothetical protein